MCIYKAPKAPVPKLNISGEEGGLAEVHPSLGLSLISELTVAATQPGSGSQHQAL